MESDNTSPFGPSRPEGGPWGSTSTPTLPPAPPTVDGQSPLWGAGPASAEPTAPPPSWSTTPAAPPPSLPPAPPVVSGFSLPARPRGCGSVVQGRLGGVRGIRFGCSRRRGGGEPLRRNRRKPARGAGHRRPGEPDPDFRHGRGRCRTGRGRSSGPVTGGGPDRDRERSRFGLRLRRERPDTDRGPRDRGISIGHRSLR